MLRNFTLTLFLSIGLAYCACAQSFTGYKISIILMDAEGNIVSETPEGKLVRGVFDPTLKTLNLSYENTEGTRSFMKYTCWNQAGQNLRLIDPYGHKVTVDKTFIQDSQKSNILILMSDEIEMNMFMSCIVVSGFYLD